MVIRLERAEEMQLQSEQRFRRFFSDASHQLRTPLTSLRGFTEVLMRGAKDDPEMSTRVLKLMKGEAERMTFLINDLLTMERLDDSRPIKKEYVDLLAIAAEEIEKTRIRSKDNRPIALSILTEQRLGLKVIQNVFTNFPSFCWITPSSMDGLPPKAQSPCSWTAKARTQLCV